MCLVNGSVTLRAGIRGDVITIHTVKVKHNVCDIYLTCIDISDTGMC